MKQRPTFVGGFDIQDPLTVSFLLAFTLFIPIISVGGVYEGLKNSSFESGVNSAENTTVLFSTLALSCPMIFDLMLDVVSYARDLEFLGLRIVSVVSMVLCAVGSLSARHTKNAASTTLFLYCWGFYVEFAVILSLMHYLIPKFMTYRRAMFTSFLFYLSFLVINLEAIPTYTSLVLDVLYYITFYSAVLIFLGIVTLWMLDLARKFLRSKHSFSVFMVKLEYEQRITLILVFSMVSIIAVFTVVIGYITPQFPRTQYLDKTSQFTFEISRMVMTVFTYVVPSRLFREKLLEAQLDLAAKREIVRWVQHELRSPLSACMLGLGEMRREVEVMHISFPAISSFASVIREKLSGLMTFTSTAIAILDDLLLCQQIEAHAVDLDMQLMNPFTATNAILRDFVDVVTVTPHVESNIANKKLRIYCDQSKLFVAFQKLLQRAVQANSRTACKIHVEINAEKREASDSRLTTQRSNGLGYASKKIFPGIIRKGWFSIFIEDEHTPQDILEIIEKLNSKRLQFEREAGEDGKLSSLGFWIAKNLLILQNGNITASRGDEGVVFQIDLPLFFLPNEDFLMNPSSNHLVLPLQNSPKNADNSGDDASYPRPLGTMAAKRLSATTLIMRAPTLSLHVLIVDDSKMVRRVMANLMGGMGHVYQEACDGFEAVDMVRKSVEAEEPFDVILMDNQMPKLMGHEATRILRHELHFEGLILGVTGNALDDDIRNFIAQGADQVVLKPLTQDKFDHAYICFTEMRKLVTS